ncbi:MAG TPA: hypothetical protein VJN95_06160 [Gemmatimonadales bacterium]|nr:hypothetical protein [Gemmatimonadales bacterium]
MKSALQARLLPFVVLTLALGCARVPGDRTVLHQPEAMIPGSFGQIISVAELRDGRVALADFRTRLFLLAGFDGKVDTVGHHADSIATADSAPGLHKLPGFIVHLAGDTLVLVDFATQRATLWNEQGQFIRTLRTVPVAGYNPAVVYDTLGHAYKADYRAIMGGLNPGETVHLDSAPVLRFARELAATADTLSMLRLPAMGEGQFGEEKKTVPVVFDPSDAFGATPDGWVWVARASSNSVDWRSPDGKWTAGVSRPWVRIPVTDADRERFMATARANGMNLQTGVRFPFAANKPPFSSSTTGQDGTVWLQRSRAIGDSVPVYDVIARGGAAVRTIQLPKGASLAAVGRNGSIYVLLREGDLQKVGRYQLK